MGQRLNIEIYSNGKVLANAYYHWSAYTGSAAEIVSKILHKIQTEDPHERDTLYAIRLLESTGAGLTNDEKSEALKNEEMKYQDFKKCDGRDYGLIAISDGGITDTRFWEEGRATIYLDEKRVNFNVFYNFGKGEWEGLWDEGEKQDSKSLPRVNIDFEDIKFDDFEEIRSKYLTGEFYSFVSTVHPDRVMETIE